MEEKGACPERTDVPLRIAVIGGGIGGLTAALSLRQAGFEVNVYEQAPELTQIGGGINMGPNAVRILRRLGLATGLDREGVRPLSTHQRRWQDGRTLQRAPLNPLCEQLYGAPQITIHRADLLEVIASRFPAERLYLGHCLAGLDDKGDSIEAWFENGVRVTADILVGADGINSTVRAALFGEEAPVFAGCVAYRGLVPIGRIADLGLETGNQSWVGPEAHLVHYPVSRGRLLNFVGWTEHDSWNREDWTDRATVARALVAFVGLASAGPADHQRRRYLLYLGIVRSRAVAAMVGRPHDFARRCVPPDVPLYGAGRGAGDRGWGCPRRVPRRRWKCRSD